MKHSVFKLIGLLLSLVGSFIGVLLLAIIMGVIGNVLSISITVLGAVGVAKILGLSITLSYNLIFILLIACGILRGCCRYIEQYFNHYIAFKLLAIIRDKIFTVLRRLCPAKLESKKKGDIIAMITSDIETLELFYAHTMSPVGIAIIVDILMVVFVSLISTWMIGLYFGLAYFIIAIIVPQFTSRKSIKLGKEARDFSSAFSADYLEQIKASKEIVLYNKTTIAVEQVSKSTKELTKLNKKVKNISLTAGLLISLVIGLLDVGVIITGMYLGLSSAVLVVVAVALMSSFGPTIAVASLHNDLNQTFASASRILDIMNEKPEVEDVLIGKDFKFNKLEVKNLSFAYDDRHLVLDNISFELNKGEVVALVGQSGIGKSTILKLLLRFYATDKGTVFYNGIPVEEISTKALKDNVVMVSQTTFLFNKSIKDNLLIAKPTASDEEIIEACKSASIYDFIEALPNKMETIFGSDQEFSFGEKQRIGLARAFLSDANLILLDEPTSNVDVINEGIILKAIKENKYNKTMLIVSHRDSVISVCDKQIYLSKEGLTKE